MVVVVAGVDAEILLEMKGLRRGIGLYRMIGEV